MVIFFILSKFSIQNQNVQKYILETYALHSAPVYTVTEMLTHVSQCIHFSFTIINM